MIAKMITCILFFLLLQLVNTVIDDELYYGDVLVSELKNKTYDEMGHLLGHTYMAETKSSADLKFRGIMWGRHRRLFLNLPVRLGDRQCPKTINVIFNVDTGAGVTTLTNDVLERLHLRCPSAIRDQSERLIEINRRNIGAINSTEDSVNLNILGSEFMHRHNIRLIVDYSEEVQEKFELEFDANKMEETAEL